MSSTTSQGETVLEVSSQADAPILAVGAELKSSVALMRDSKVFVSPSIGRLDDPDAYRRFVTEVEALCRRHDAQPTIIAHDLHPQYAATRWALEQPAGKHVGVQHHHAHIIAGMADHALRGKVVGLACDGTGYGTDGTIWGCEVLVCDFETGEFRRAGWLRPFSLLGGDAAAVETYRPAMGVLVETFGADWPVEAQHLLDSVDPSALKMAVARLGAPSARLPRTSSLGRLFDATAFLLGLCSRNDTEAKAPIAVQQAAETCPSTEVLDYSLETTDDGAIVMDYRPMIRAMVKELGYTSKAQKESQHRLARAFHETLVKMLRETVARICEAAKEHRVVLSGGCFLNSLLRTGVEEQLRRDGLDVYSHQQLSCGDENIAVGQAIIAAQQLHRESR
ncbi:MAG: carbamoyltransferase HypF [Phycisphaerae bacterium]|nr:carbamoyltransferase HypF [Phycisphaerae bacterium]